MHIYLDEWLGFYDKLVEDPITYQRPLQQTHHQSLRIFGGICFFPIAP